ncbi:ribose import ATP-binding protein RbsA 1 [Labrys miyagiensis]|uniref:Ribose import ATP-binding protein RbsA 1 n=1 Tax=Labrys miyagiensis TaxID=346912 RepID=A0ABQ6CM75_9HYPH|nr:sugar ABC transporter ATP-binding protein [Labrys miyagiensis]GLS19362.1 ribose import ATP-binding protein RbsA 1 [Labrys miyagiensis]
MAGDDNLLLRIHGVAKRFNSVVALRSADLEVQAGEVHALMGANGAGKSTLVKIITGVYPADGGEITLAGKPSVFRSPAEARRAGIVSVYQDPAIVPDLTVAQNMRLARVPLEAVKAAMRTLGIDHIDLSRTARDIDFALLRLIDLSRALASNPSILLLDEITAALPADLSERVFQVVRDWRRGGKSVIFISHRMAEVAALCDRATVLRDGVTVGVTPTAGAEAKIVNMMLGTDVAKAAAAVERRAANIATGGPPALEVRNLNYGHAVRDVSFSVAPGEVLGVAALEGQGQEELFDCIAGVRRADAGEVRAHGELLRLRHPADAIRAGLVLVPANRLQALLHQRSVRENIALSAFGALRSWGAIAMGAERHRVDDAIQRLQIDTRAAPEVRRLSGGNQQKVVIARWIASGFRTLLCFDPTRGIDVGTKQQIYALLREVAGQGASVLLFTSELPEIRLACDRAIVLFGGRISGEMPAEKADEARLLHAAHGLPPAETAEVRA